MQYFDSLTRAVAAVGAPSIDVIEWANALDEPLRREQINTPYRIAMFLGQGSEESGGFTVLSENLTYSSAQRLMQVWPSRFPTTASAAPYVNNPEALANFVYANRLGNGDAASGDGYRFRGAGLIQLTGRNLHERFAASVGLDVNECAEWMLTPPGAAASAAWYWTERGGLLELSDAWDIASVTKRINGGLTNLDTRIKLCNAALEAIKET